jgi:hypothetical protein
MIGGANLTTGTTTRTLQSDIGNISNVILLLEYIFVLLICDVISSVLLITQSKPDQGELGRFGWRALPQPVILPSQSQSRANNTVPKDFNHSAALSHFLQNSSS